MSKKLIQGVAVALGLLFLAPSVAVAEKGFPCLKGGTGKTLIWNASWQSDRKDDNVVYQIGEILHFETNNSYTTVLKLIAEQSATKETRHLPISSVASARMVCESLSTSQTKSRSSQKTMVKSDSTASRSKRRTPQFIKYVRQGWVRADLPRTQIPLDTCIIMGREFLCLEEDKQRFGEQLQLVAEQIEAQPQLRR